VELWAKLSANEKFEAYGVVGVVVGWILGLILGSASVCVGGYCVGTINYFNWGTAGLLGMLALALGVVLGVVLFLKISPSAGITCPVPVGQIILIVSAAALVCAALMTLIQFTNGGSPPVLMYIADVLMIGGAAVATWFAYQTWMASKA